MIRARWSRSCQNRFCVEELQLVLAIAHELAKTGVVEEQPPILVDDVQSGRAVFEDLAELAFVLGNLCLALPQRRDVVDPQHPFAAEEAHMPAAVCHLDVGDQHMD